MFGSRRIILFLQLNSFYLLVCNYFYRLGRNITRDHYDRVFWFVFTVSWQSSCYICNNITNKHSICRQNYCEFIYKINNLNYLFFHLDWSFLWNICYSLLSETWESCTSLPSSVCSPPCCVYQNDIYLFGPLLYCYRQAVSNWEIISKFVLPDKMSAAVAMSDDNTIFVIGK